jgi:hypothetical protein
VPTTLPCLLLCCALLFRLPRSPAAADGLQQLTDGVALEQTAFDVRHLNHTAHMQRLPPSLRSASMLCTMHNATKHCGLRKRGNKALKAPRNEELYKFLFKKPPVGQLHSALPDCRVTLASFVEGRKRKWW